MFTRIIAFSSICLLVTSAAGCWGLAPLASADKHKFLPGSLIRGHVISSKYRAEIKIDEVLYGDASLLGRSFSVQTSDDSSYGESVVRPVLKVGENAIWPVWEGHDSHLGSDGKKHINTQTFIQYDSDSYAGRWPIREGDRLSYSKAPAIAAVLKLLEASTNWSEFNASLARLCNDEKDPYLASWEKRLQQSCRSIVN